MPELPEVEAVCRKLRGEVVGRRITGVSVLRAGVTRPQSSDEIEAAVRGRDVEAVERRAKNVLIRLTGGVFIRVHLRMTGNLYVIPDVRLRPAATRVYFEIGHRRAMVFEDGRALGRVNVHSEGEVQRLLGKLGLEPLSEGFTAGWLAEAARRSRRPAKLFLMDQNQIAGLGNIYAAEALFHARVHPGKVMNRLRGPKIHALHGAIVRVLRDAVQSACIAYSHPGRFSEAESYQCFVYDREGQPCLNCGRLIRRIAQGGRSTYYCPGCQK
jgi:formamidopyrimidine-DNA glycosylase